MNSSSRRSDYCEVCDDIFMQEICLFREDKRSYSVIRNKAN